MSMCLSMIYRLFMSVGFLVLLIAVIDWIMRMFDYTLTITDYQPGRLFEFAAILMIVAICILLRQIRDKIK